MVRYSLYMVHCTLYIVHCTLYNPVGYNRTRAVHGCTFRFTLWKVSWSKRGRFVKLNLHSTERENMSYVADVRTDLLDYVQIQVAHQFAT